MRCGHSCTPRHLLLARRFPVRRRAIQRSAIHWQPSPVKGSLALRVHPRRSHRLQSGPGVIPTHCPSKKQDSFQKSEHLSRDFPGSVSRSGVYIPHRPSGGSGRAITCDFHWGVGPILASTQQGIERCQCHLTVLIELATSPMFSHPPMDCTPVHKLVALRYVVCLESWLVGQVPSVAQEPNSATKLPR